MSPLSKPSLVLPQPLRAAEIPSFTNYSVVVRLPDIARRALAENIFPVETVKRIQSLINEIPMGAIRSFDTPHAPDNALWAEWIRPYEGMNWLDVPWFFAEEYFYRRILEASGYFADGPWHGRDPYTHQKHLGLESSRPQIRALADHIKAMEQTGKESVQDALARLLLLDLWGNQNDLSMWPVQHGGAAHHNGSSDTDLAAAQEHILTNQLPQALEYLTGFDPAKTRVDILLDNAGYELITDLALADYLLAGGHAAHIGLHAKAYPVFVSDAIEKDIHDTLDYLTFDEHPSVADMAIRLRGCLLDQRLTLHQNSFWTSPLAAWEMPAELVDEISRASLLIAKGDANYRRLLGDLHWDYEQPFGDVVDYFPCGVLALRTLKSEIAVGIQPGSEPSSDPNWMINGKWGLVEFTSPRQ